MKKIYITLLSALGVLGLSSAYAQVSAYTFTQSAGTFTPITGGTDVNAIEVDYGISASIPLGFSFFFDGTTYTSVKAASDGFLTFGTTTSSSTTNDLDAIGATSRPLIAALWDDLAGAASSSSQASYVVTGTAPNRVFTFEWLNWEWNYSSTGAAISFQIKLYETTNVVEMVYRGEAAAVSSGSASIGLTGVSSFMSLNGTGASPTASTTTETTSLNTKPADGQTYIFTPPTCLAPSGLSATALTSSSADLNWTEAGSATTWNIEYGPTGFTQGSGTMVTGTITNPTPISSLSSATTYQFYVQADCGGGDLSAWTGPVSFTTLCGTYTPAYSQNFATYIPACWTEAKGALQTSTTLTGTSSNWTSDGFGNNGTTGSARINIYGTTSSPNEWLISPTIDLGTGNNYQLDFDVAYTGFSGTSSATMDADDSLVLVISLDNGATWSKTNALQIWTAGSEPTNTGDHIVKNLSAYSGLVKFGFYGTSTVSGVDNNAYIDNFMIDVTPACAAPSALSAANITSGSADLSWVEGGSATMWNIEYGVTGFTPTGTPTISGVTNGGNGSAYNLGSLASQTTYDYYVQADCGAAQSAWVGPFTFSTPCNAITSFPWTEDFDAVTTPNLPSCWSQINNNGDTDFWKTFSTYGVGGTNAAGLYTDFNGGSNDDYLVLPAFTLTGNERLSFTVRARSSSEPNDYEVLLSTASNTPADFTNTLMPLTTVSSTTHTAVSPIDLSAYSGDVYIAIHVPSGGLDGYYIYFDDFLLEEIPSCLEPSALTITNLTATSVDFGWTDAVASEWEVVYGAPGFTPMPSGSSTTSNPEPSGTLTPSTDYEFYVRAICTVGDTSVWAGPYAFSTPCLSVIAPWTESFDNTTIPACWSMSGPENWLFTTTWVDYGAYGLDDHTGNGGSFAGVDGSGGNNSNVILESPYIDVTALTVPALEFYYFSNNEDNPGDNNELQVEVWDGAAWNTVRTIAEDNPDWVKHSIVLGSLNITGDIQVRFVVNQTASPAYYNDQIIDDVSVLEAPTCPEPYSLSLVSSVADTAILSWNAGYLETSWNIEYGPVGFTPGTGTVVATTASPDTITGLSVNSGYDFYIQADCGGGDVSLYNGPLTVFTEITNDDACGALFVPADGQLRYYNNSTATTQTGESSLAGASNRTLWFKTEVPASGHIALATCGTTFDSEIAAYEYFTDCSDLSTFVEIDYADFNPWGSSTCSGVHPGGLALCGLTPGDTIMFYVGSYYSSASDAGTFPIAIWDLEEEAGTGSSTQACAGLDTINLVPLVTGTMSHFGGYFDYVTNSSAIIDDTLAAAANFTVGNDQVIYVVETDCASDTAFINITVLSQDGSGTAINPFTSCNSDVFLMDGLTGSVQSGGTWSDDAATGLLAGPNHNIFVAGGVPVGTYPFTYTIDNGVCPPSSTTVEVIIANCTDVSENDMQVSLYPNPNNGNFFIVSDKSEETSIVMTDIRGKVIYNVSTVVNAGAAFEINLNNVEAGMYMLNITSASGTKIMNVVIK